MSKCKASGKRKYATRLDCIVYYARIHSSVMIRPYLCPDCGSWHASRKQHPEFAPTPVSEGSVGR